VVISHDRACYRSLRLRTHCRAMSLPEIRT
jgi:hypothetical protein